MFGLAELSKLAHTKCLNLYNFRNSQMSISQALSKLKRLPIRGQLGLRLIDPLEQNQRFGAKLKVPKLFIPPLATKYRPLILWEVNRVL